MTFSLTGDARARASPPANPFFSRQSAIPCPRSGMGPVAQLVFKTSAVV